MGFEISNRDWQIAYDYAKNAILSADPAHDFDHILRVVRLTRQLCEKIPYASISLAMLIALLHEMNDDKLFPVSQVEKTREMLLSLSLSSDEADFIIEAISLISYRKHPTLSEDTRIEVKIVQDADRIDALGAIGVARAFAYGGSKGRPLYSRDGGEADTISHFYDKLLLIYDLLNTAEARELAKPRNEFLKLFVKNFMQEMNDIDNSQ